MKKSHEPRNRERVEYQQEKHKVLRTNRRGKKKYDRRIKVINRASLYSWLSLSDWVITGSSVKRFEGRLNKSFSEPT